MKKLIYILFSIFSLQLYAAPGVTYFTKASGAWNDANTWGTLCGAGVGAVPTANDYVIICSGYTVTTAAAASCQTLTINNGGILECNAGSVFSSSTATTISGILNIVGGTFNTSANINIFGSFNLSNGTFNSDKAFYVQATGVANIVGGSLNLTGGANDDLFVDGSLNHLGGTIDVNNKTLIQFGGELNIGGTANFIARSDFEMVYGAGGLVSMTGGNMTFMADFFSNIPANNFIQTAGTITFTGTGSRWTMKAIYQASGTAEAIFDGDTELYLLAGGEWHFYDLTINPGKIMDQNNVDTITVAHDWENNSGTYTHNSNLVIFDGIENQSIGGTSATTFYDIVFQNTGATGSDNIVLNQPTTVSNTQLFEDGIVVSTLINILTLTNNLTTASNGGNAGSFVSGPMAWNLTTGGTYEFPLGKAPSKWARAALSDLTGSTYFTAEYFMSSYSAVDTSDINEPLENVSIIEYWDISEIDANIDAAVTLYWEDAAYSGISSCTPGGDLVVAHYGTKWESLGNSGGITGSCAGPGSAGTVKGSISTSFSPFTFGSGGINPLPIELLSFSASQNGSVVELYWSTASEVNNDFFTVEKTVDGVNYETVEIVNGAGNSTSNLNYLAVDYDPFNQASYYRLKQTDYDGNYSYSDLVMIAFDDTDNFSFEIYPNPNDGEYFHINIITNKSEMVLVVVHDIYGKKMYSQVLITSQNGNNVYAMDPSKKLISGVYMITAASNHKVYNKRLVVD